MFVYHNEHLRTIPVTYIQDFELKKGRCTIDYIRLLASLFLSIMVSIFTEQVGK